MTRKVVLSLGISVFLLAGCGILGGKNSAKSTDITDPTTPAPAPTVVSDASTGKLPTSCNSVLTAPELTKALGKKLSGQTVPIRGKEEKNIGRTGRFTCRYGVSKQLPSTSDGTKVGDIPVEVGISAYRTVSDASQRIEFTIDHQQPDTASTKIDLGSVSGTLFSEKGGAMLIFANQRLTYAVSVSDKIVKGDSAKQALLAMANNVLNHAA